MNNLANPIRKRLFELDLNQTELGKRLGRSSAWTSNLTNYRLTPRPAEQAAIAKVLKTTIDALWPVLTGEVGA